MQKSKSKNMVREGGLEPPCLLGATPSRWCVCQFHHSREESLLSRSRHAGRRGWNWRRHHFHFHIGSNRCGSTRWSRRRSCSGRLFIAQNGLRRTRRAIRDDSQRQRSRDKHNSQENRSFGKKRGGSARPKSRLTSHASKSASDISAFGTLQKNNQDKDQARQHVQTY